MRDNIFTSFARVSNGILVNFEIWRVFVHNNYRLIYMTLSPYECMYTSEMFFTSMLPFRHLSFATHDAK